MKVFFISVWLFFVSQSMLYSSLIGANICFNDVKVLKQFDIDPSFITDYELQKRYQQLLNKGKFNYVRNLNNASLFIPIIKKHLKENSIPESFLFMVMAESNFKLDAKSYLKAKGLWQFMPFTAKSFGLKNNSYIDERMDIIKSTKAASKYLQYLHKKFGNWYLAIMGYNCGAGRIIEGITRVTLDNYCKTNNCSSDKFKNYKKVIKDYQEKKTPFWALNKIYKEMLKVDYKPTFEDLLVVQEGIDRQYIPQESAAYIRKIVALSMLSKDNSLIYENSHLSNMGLNSSITEVKVKGGVHLINLAKTLKIDLKKLQSLNKHLRKSITPPNERSTTIYIPYDRLTIFNKNIKELKSSNIIHIVKSGDSLGWIGNKYGISYKLIKNYNNLTSDILKIGQILTIPLDAEVVIKLSKEEKKIVIKS